MNCLQVGFLPVKFTSTVLAIAVAAVLVGDQSDGRGSRKIFLAYKNPSPMITKMANLVRRLACRFRKTKMGNSAQRKSVMTAVPTFV